MDSKTVPGFSFSKTSRRALLALAALLISATTPVSAAPAPRPTDRLIPNLSGSWSRISEPNANFPFASFFSVSCTNYYCDIAGEYWYSSPVCTHSVALNGVLFADGTFYLNNPYDLDFLPNKVETVTHGFLFTGKWTFADATLTLWFDNQRPDLGSFGVFDLFRDSGGTVIGGEGIEVEPGPLPTLPPEQALATMPE